MRMKLEKLFESKIEVTDEEIKTYYEENKDTFTEPEQVHASHILLETEEEANEILAQLNEGADFAELAKEHSKDPGSAQNGGDLGFFGRGEMVPEFEEAAFSLEVGEMSGVVESEHGYHIIKVTDKKEAKEYTLEEKREEIREQLFAQKLNAQVPAWLNELKQNAEIEKM